jgi:hypothetical protein
MGSVKGTSKDAVQLNLTGPGFVHVLKPLIPLLQSKLNKSDVAITKVAQLPHLHLLNML